MLDKQYWFNYLENSTLSLLPHDFLRPLNNKAVEANHSFEVPNTKQYDFFYGLSTFAVLVYRLTGDEDIVIATDAEDGKEIIIRLTFGPTVKFGELVNQVKTEYHRSVEKANYNTLDEIALFIQEKQQLEALPLLFRLSYQRAQKHHQLSTSVSGSVRDLAIFVTENGRRLIIYYNSLLFKSSRMQVLGEQFQKFIGSITGEDEITKINLVTDTQKLYLPDPTEDLDWSGYKGSIQDIFLRNAKEFPSRDCVVETKSFFDPNSETRVFTYAQIDGASNIVGNYLKETGIKKGDVVTIYAYRGVDLVVAVMGVLKAGACFSVIDPAYPPARQNIYLMVAKPRGIIGIEKAGELDSAVIEYVRKELDVITSIPQLRTNDDGSLSGGRLGGLQVDCLLAYAHYADKPTGVKVGPDSNPTLSFTSGSEGIPKGVLGRHFSLAYYFPWMARRFGLSEKDKFTMLSGIAHDPIQRDMFTPLFLGAQLLVPTADDIGTPGKLAEWMATYEANVTHLTPAMGQLLSAQATSEIPSLHHAFFVGDILTKRDCLRLQSLAENVFIVNMYGTTETQRSVSYFEIKSRKADSTFLRNQKDVMPAGRGMQNVQMIVVNRNDREQTCGVGEIGEIYVRGAGLAEGYRGQPDLTAAKFVTNWYVDPKVWIEKDEKRNKENEDWRNQGWYGPRDRLYRTGDLGRYLPHGDVECCGRADDQVKIRGFRIELGEIDTHLSQHSLVRENITLVRRDKNEEPTLISYIVPKDTLELQKLISKDVDISNPIVKGLTVYADLIKDIKAFLKKRLASYAVPTFVLPLARLPLNPNGKVDKPKLPFPDTAHLEAVAQITARNKGDDEASGLTGLECQVRDLWLEVLPSHPASISKEDSFFDLGGHSILATRMIFQLRNKLAVEIPLGVIFKYPTLEAFAAQVQKAVGSEEVEVANLYSQEETVEEKGVDYAADARQLIEQTLLPSYSSRTSIETSQTINVFVTGVTGFLGSFLLRDLCERSAPSIKVFAHVRAPSKEAGLERIRQASKTFDIWKDNWESKIEIVLGDLSKPDFGNKKVYEELTNHVDVVIHNGAFVHWVYPYSTLRDANVISTINILNLCGHGKPKLFTFVSSTSALDTDYYIRLSDEKLAKGEKGISEDDDLDGSSKGIGTGYGQSKWVSEHVIREAGRRGLRGSIVRSGYVSGFSKTGASNTDDFLLRMLKGCAELGSYPDIANGVNVVPVDHVARLTVAASFHLVHKNGLSVVHVNGDPRIQFKDYLGSLETYGYTLTKTDYPTWKIALEKFVTQDNNNSALFPLLHFVLENLPQDTKAPELDTTNATKVLKQASLFGGEASSSVGCVDLAQMGIYISYLVKIGYLPEPSRKNLPLPQIKLSDEALTLIKSGAGTRSSAAK